MENLIPKEKSRYREDRLDNDETWKGVNGKVNTLKKRIRYWFTESKKEIGLNKKRIDAIKMANEEIKAMGGKPLQYKKYIKECGFED